MINEELECKKTFIGTLDLWDRVQETNPFYTKKANVKGNQITSIAPQYQLHQATKEFGIYGETWGFKSLDFDYTLRDIGMIVLKAVFYYPKGEFPIVNSVQLYRDGAMTKIDDDFAKKVETDTLTKALSKLGFNADIFMGRFDDTKYFEELKEKYKPQIETPKQQRTDKQMMLPPITDEAFEKATEAVEKGTVTVAQIKAKYVLSTTQEKALELLQGVFKK